MSTASPSPIARVSPMECAPLGKPAFSTFVVFDVAVRPAGADLGEAEVELLDVCVLGERRPGALEHDPPLLPHVALVGNGQRPGGVLLDHQPGPPLLSV